MEGKTFRNLKLYRWDFAVIWAISIVISLDLFYLIFTKSFGLFPFLCALFMFSLPISFYLFVYKNKLTIREDEIIVDYGFRKNIFKYYELDKMYVFPSLYAPHIALDTKNKESALMVTDFFVNHEAKKFVDFLISKNPNIKDEVNWNSFLVKHIKM